MNLYNLLGIDREILLLCSAKEQKLYQLFTYLQLGLIIIVGFSWYYIIDVIFDNTIVSIVLGVFLAFIFFNLYRFVLLTVSGKKAKTKKEKASIILPHLFKISVIAIFSVFISFPIELFVHKNYIEKNLPDVLSAKIEEVKLEIDSIYQTKENELLSRVYYYQSQLDRLESDIKEQNKKLKNPDYKISKSQIGKHLINLNTDLALKRQKFLPIINEKKNVIAGLNNEKQKEIEQYERIIKNSNLLVERFALLFSQKPVTESLLTLFIILLFLSPLLFKLISIYYHNFKYEKFNTEKMREEIAYNYEQFKQSYREITFSIFCEEKEFLELYDDAPFNTIKKTDKRKKDKKGCFSLFLMQTHHKL